MKTTTTIQTLPVQSKTKDGGNTMKAKILRCLIISSVLPLVALQRSPAANLTDQLARFQSQLEKFAYVSQTGTEEAVDLNEWYCAGSLFSAIWANPQAPYITTRLPEVAGQAPNSNPPATWRLREDEAVVLIGLTPPPLAYFSFDFTMMKGFLTDGPLLWVSVGDPVNNMTVRTTGATPYDRPFALVITGHRRTEAEVNKMLATAGLGGAINNVTIPPAMFRLGLDEGSDEFFFGTRTAVPEPGFEQARDEYLAAPPLWAFRVRPKNNSADETQPVYAPDPLPVPPLRVSGTGTTELDLNPALQLLRQRIIEAYPGYTAQDVPVERGFEESYPGLQNKLLINPPIQGVGAYSYDCRYLMSPTFILPDGSFLVAYGPHHVSTRKASYASISVYVDADAALILKTRNHVELQSSARDFIADQQDADKFYAWAFTRAGSSGPQGPHVTPLPATDTCYCEPYGTTRAVDMSTVQHLVRIYAEPATKSRPALSELLLDRLLLFTPK
jgi:hypothetical protein